MAEAARNLEDVPPLPGEAKSWAPGESTAGMPSADGGAYSGTDTKAVTDKMAANTRDKIERADKLYGEVEATQQRLLPRIEELSKNVGVEAEKMKPWDADEQMAKYRTDPVEAFGSLGSVFGILASAFTNAPFENALNASAAAMHAVKAGDDKAYERAFKSWQDNTKMALDRHRIQHDAYTSAVSLLQTNMAAANTRLQIDAARFGDKQMLALLEAGMNKEVQELINSRQKMAEELEKNRRENLVEGAKVSRLFALGYDPKNPQSEKSQEALVKFQREQAELKRMSSPYGSGASNLTTDRQRAQDVARHREELRAEKNEDGSPKYTEEEIAEKAAQFERRLRAMAATPSGNRIDDITSRINRIDYMESTIEKIEQLLYKHRAIAGLGGAATRPLEVIGNWFGSNETDRKQFERYINELQEWAPRILNDSSGRPLAAEAGKVGKIVAGLSAGDTTANTLRAYREFKELMARMRGDLEARRTGTVGTGAAPASPSSEPAWKRAPLAVQ